MTLTGNPTGGTFSGAGVNGNTFTPSLTTVGPQTVTYNFTDVITGCSNSTSQTITINAVPIVAFSAIPAICFDAAPLNLTQGSPAGGTYSGNSVSGSSFDPALAGVGVYTLTYSITDANGCNGSATQTITVNALPTVGLQGLDLTYCVNGLPDQIFGFPIGGIFSGNGVSTGTFDPSIAGVGSQTATYSFTDVNGCSNSATQTTLVGSVGTATITGLAGPYCVSSPSVTISGTPSGGTFSGPGTSGTTFQPALAGAGTFTITYSVLDANSCTVSATQTVVVNTSPTVTFSGLNPAYCESDAAVTMTGNPSGGTFTGTGVTSSTFDPTSAGIGQFVITYTAGSGGCTGTSTQTVTVNSVPTVSIFGLNATYCLSQTTPVNIIGSPSGGIYSGNGVSGTQFTPSLAGVGVHTISYSFANASGCAGQTTTQVTVTANPTATFTGLQTVYCLNDAVSILTGTPTGGTFSGTGTNATTFNPATAGLGSQTVSYSFTDNNGCTGSTTQTATINSVPVVSFTGLAASYCNTSATLFPLTGIPAGGVFAGPGISGNDFNPAATGGNGTFTISYAVTDANGCTGKDSTTTVVSNAPSISITAGSGTAICAGNSTLLAASAGFVSYDWSDGTASVGANQTLPVSQAGTYTVTGTTANSCVVTSSPISVTLNPGVIINLGNDTSICPQGSLVLNAGAGFAGYLWNTAATSPTITISGAGTFSVTVTDNNGCIGTDAIIISQSSSLAVSIVPAGPTSFCEGGSVTLNTSGTFSSYLWSNSSTSNSITVTQSGIFNVSVADAAGCVGSSQTVTVNVSQAPNPSITSNGSSYLCNGQSVQLTASNGFTNYIWTPNATPGQSITVNQPGSYTVSVTGANGCTGTSVPFTVSVNPPLNPVVSADGPTDFCFGESVTLSVAIQGNLNLSIWNVNQNPTAHQITVFESGSYSVVVMDDHNCVDSTTANPTIITVHQPQPQVSFQNNTFIGPGGFATYQWYLDGQPITGATSQTYIAQKSGSYSLLVTDAFGCTGWSNIIEYTYVNIGMKDIDGAAINLNVLPNPTEGVFELKANFANTAKVKIEILDIVGKCVIQPKEENLMGEFSRMYNLNHLSDGVYTVKVLVGDNLYVKKLIKQ